MQCPCTGTTTDLGACPVGRAAGGGHLEGLLEGVGDDPVDGADPDADPGDRTARGPPLDRLEHAFAVAHLVHAAALLYIERMRR